MTTACDHVVGVEPEGCSYIRMSDRAISSKVRYDRHHEWALRHGRMCPKIVERKKDWTLDDFFWNEVVEFNFCPECGAPIERTDNETR